MTRSRSRSAHTLNQLINVVNWLEARVGSASLPDGVGPSDLLNLLYQLLAYLLGAFYEVASPTAIIEAFQRIAAYVLEGNLAMSVVEQVLQVLQTATSPVTAALQIKTIYWACRPALR